MATFRSCGWCHAMNPTTERFCKECGHEAHVSRMLCHCPRCAPQAPRAEPSGVTTAAEAVATILAELAEEGRSDEDGDKGQSTAPGQAFPPELALGNVVRLKRPYWGQQRRPERDKPFTHGIIVQQLHRTGGVWVVSLHLYDPDGGLYLHRPSLVPVYVDLPANELVLHKLAGECGYRTVDHDLYPAPEGEEVGYDFVPLPDPGPYRGKRAGDSHPKP
jgi:hypothetical protein